MILLFLKLVQDEFGGQRTHMYKDACDSGEILFGQAFMNALRGTPYYDELSGSLHDTFYTNDVYKIESAIDFLTSK